VSLACSFAASDSLTCVVRRCPCIGHERRSNSRPYPVIHPSVPTTATGRARAGQPAWPWAHGHPSKAARRRTKFPRGPSPSAFSNGKPALPCLVVPCVPLTSRLGRAGHAHGIAMAARGHCTRTRRRPARRFPQAQGIHEERTSARRGRAVETPAEVDFLVRWTRHGVDDDTVLTWPAPLTRCGCAEERDRALASSEKSLAFRSTRQVLFFYTHNPTLD
jgi:hypothetical protein